MVGGLLLGALTGCGIGVEPAERAVAALPGVVSADFDFDAGGLIDDRPTLDASVVLTPQASVDDVVAVASRAIGRINAARVPGLYGRLRITTADLPDDPLVVRLSPPIEPDLVAAEARHWWLLREQWPGARLELGTLELDRGWERSISVTTPGADVRGELVAAFATFDRIPGEPATRSRLDVRVEDPTSRYSHPPILFSSAQDVPSSEVLAAMAALAELAPSAPRFGNGVVVHWYDVGPDHQPHLDVELAIGLDEFYRTPGNQIMDQIPGSDTERVALAHQAVLDAAGIPYRLRASVFTSPFFLEVDRRLGR